MKTDLKRKDDTSTKTSRITQTPDQEAGTKKYKHQDTAEEI